MYGTAEYLVISNSHKYQLFENDRIPIHLEDSPARVFLGGPWLIHAFIFGKILYNIEKCTYLSLVFSLTHCHEQTHPCNSHQGIEHDQHPRHNANVKQHRSQVASTRPMGWILTSTLFYPARHRVSTWQQHRAPCSQLRSSYIYTVLKLHSALLRQPWGWCGPQCKWVWHPWLRTSKSTQYLSHIW